MHFVVILKFIFIFVLIAAFIVLIAHESITKFMERGIMVEVSSLQAESGLIAPSVTFCGNEPNVA